MPCDHALSARVNPRDIREKMALVPPAPGYESGEYLCSNLTREILAQSKHGVASVSNVNGRAIFVVNAIVRRPRRHSKPMYDYANILGYVGGEIRDGYFKANLKESEAIRMIQMHTDLCAANPTRPSFAPVEDVAALCVLPMYEKSVERGFGFPDKGTENAFECVKKVAKYSSYQSPESFFDTNLGDGPQNPDNSRFDKPRIELQAWFLEKEDLDYHNCELPPNPPKDVKIPQRFLDLGHIGYMVHCCHHAVSWKKTAAEKCSSPLNFERFSYMAKHQAKWYIWMGDLDRASVMVNSWKGFLEDQKNGKFLSQDNVVFGIILDLTYYHGIGLHDGTTKLDARRTPRDRCDICSTRASKISASVYTNVLTCVDKDGVGEFGSHEMRKELAKLLFAVYQFGVDMNVKTAANLCFEKPFDVFLNHAFENLFWLNKPTNAMVLTTTKDVVAGFCKAISFKSPGELNVIELAESCKFVLRDALLKNCSSKLVSADFDMICDLFQTKFQKVIKEFKKLIKSSMKEDAASSAAKIAHDLIANNVVPHLAFDFKNTWRFLSSAKKKKILMANSELLKQSCAEAFEEVQAQKSSTKEKSAGACFLPGACGDVPCACNDKEKLKNHLIDVLSSKDNPVPFYSCLDNGDIVISEEFCSGNEREYYSGMPAFNIKHVSSTIEALRKESFADCPRLGALCKISCHIIYKKLITHLIREFEELDKKPNPRFQWHTCQSCGQVESELGEFKRCGGCKSVYYCGRKCQAQDWKAGHKQKCKTTTGES